MGCGGYGGAASSWASPSHDTRIVSADQGGAAKISDAVISKFWLQGRFGPIRKQTQSYSDMSMTRSNNLSQKDVEQVCQVREMFQNIDHVCAVSQFLYGKEGESDKNASLCWPFADIPVP